MITRKVMPWILESDKCPGLWENFYKKFKEEKHFCPMDLSLKKGND